MGTEVLYEIEINGNKGINPQTQNSHTIPLTIATEYCFSV